MNRRDRAPFQTEMVEFLGLPFSSSKKLKIWSFHVVVVQERQRNVQKSVMHVQLELLFCKPSPSLDRLYARRPDQDRHATQTILPFSCPVFSPFAGYLVGYMFILVGKVFQLLGWIPGLDGRKGKWTVEQDFHGDFWVNETYFLAFFSVLLD